GSVVLGHFMAVTNVPQKLADWVVALPMNRYLILIVICLIYEIGGSFIDDLPFMILATPIFFPAVLKLGFDPIWFGIIVVMTVELGLITPPVGMNVFVIKSVIPDASFATIFRGVAPFVFTDVIRLVILIAFPILALWLPQRMMG
ncbi:MAG: TRAP transporter large permease subunit, partial [Bradyrhizobium sp.]|nr:TRAP transporter large permease subunit [Bradyrhizobium sp.]